MRVIMQIKDIKSLSVANSSFPSVLYEPVYAHRKLPQWLALL